MNFKKTCGCVFTFMLIAVLGIALPGCAQRSGEKTSIKEVKQETQDLIQALKGYTADQRDEAIQKTKSALQSLDRRINALETRVDNNWDNMNKAAREKARANLKALRQQRTKVAEWYGSLKNSTVNAWEHMKKGFSNAYSALYDAWEKSEKEFSAGK